MFKILPNTFLLFIGIYYSIIREFEKKQLLINRTGKKNGRNFTLLIRMYVSEEKLLDIRYTRNNYLEIINFGERVR